MHFEVLIYRNLVEFLRMRGDMELGTVSRTTTLSELEVDSFDLVAMAELIEQKYRIHLADAELKSALTIGDLAAFVADKFRSSIDSVGGHRYEGAMVGTTAADGEPCRRSARLIGG